MVAFLQILIFFNGMRRVFYILILILAFLYIFLPEVTDVIPLVGWLDEGLAIFLITFALKKLGVNIPWIEKIIRIFRRRKS